MTPGICKVKRSLLKEPYTTLSIIILRFVLIYCVLDFCYVWRAIRMDTHTHSQLYRIPRAATPRGIKIYHQEFTL